MLDALQLPSQVHPIVGAVVLGCCFASALICGLLAWKRRPATKPVYGLLLITQLVMILQGLIGVKLLDQGFGAVQRYEHYVGGLIPLLFYLSFYWFPQADPRRRQIALAVATAGGFVFALISFIAGYTFVRMST